MPVYAHKIQINCWGLEIFISRLQNSPYTNSPKIRLSFGRFPDEKQMQLSKSITGSSSIRWNLTSLPWHQIAKAVINCLYSTTCFSQFSDLDFISTVLLEHRNEHCAFIHAVNLHLEFPFFKSNSCLVFKVWCKYCYFMLNSHDTLTPYSSLSPLNFETLIFYFSKNPFLIVESLWLFYNCSTTLFLYSRNEKCIKKSLKHGKITHCTFRFLRILLIMCFSRKSINMLSSF